MTVIKASDRGASIQSVAFNFADMDGEANRHLDRYRDQARTMLAEARREAETIRERAMIEGREAAETAVRAQLAVEQSQRIATLLPALTQVVGRIRDAKQAWLAHWEQSAVHVASAIAARAIRRELASRPEIPMTLIREALELAVGSDRLRIRLNPADWESLGPDVEKLAAELAPLAPAEITADPAISLGGCRVETCFGAIDQTFESQLARIEEELT
ncbi:MAG: hypothetical protein JW809_07195 [Pirellulales bacterium]|nr:hypothetical protein [Pirellulales bacterium]